MTKGRGDRTRPPLSPDSRLGRKLESGCASGHGWNRGARQAPTLRFSVAGNIVLLQQKFLWNETGPSPPYGGAGRPAAPSCGRAADGFSDMQVEPRAAGLGPVTGHIPGGRAFPAPPTPPGVWAAARGEGCRRLWRTSVCVDESVLSLQCPSRGSPGRQGQEGSGGQPCDLGHVLWMAVAASWWEGSLGTTRSPVISPGPADDFGLSKPSTSPAPPKPGGASQP